MEPRTSVIVRWLTQPLRSAHRTSGSPCMIHRRRGDDARRRERTRRFESDCASVRQTMSFLCIRRFSDAAGTSLLGSHGARLAQHIERVGRDALLGQALVHVEIVGDELRHRDFEGQVLRRCNAAGVRPLLGRVVDDAGGAGAFRSALNLSSSSCSTSWHAGGMKLPAHPSSTIQGSSMLTKLGAFDGSNS
jgi:hypothetical protein